MTSDREPQSLTLGEIERLEGMHDSDHCPLMCCGVFRLAGDDEVQGYGAVTGRHVCAITRLIATARLAHGKRLA